MRRSLQQLMFLATIEAVLGSGLRAPGEWSSCELFLAGAVQIYSAISSLSCAMPSLYCHTTHSALAYTAYSALHYCRNIFYPTGAGRHKQKVHHVAHD